MTERFHAIRAEGISLTLDLAAGHIRSLEITHEGRRLTPLYTAPWVDDAAIYGDESIPANLRHLSGDFFCAPFGAADEAGTPPHGWPANSRWNPLDTAPHPAGGVVARYVLATRVSGARLVKELTLRDGHPFVYARHIFEGGSGAVSVASHPMTHFATRGRLSFSPKAYAETPDTAPEPDPARGRSALRYPAHFTDLNQAPLQGGGATDLCSYPIADRHEDFVMLVEAAGGRLGWAAAVRDEPGDILLSLKNPRNLPVTMLWFSNGGRDYKPWNGRNVGVLGIEEARAWSAYGAAASVAPNALSESGVPTALALNPEGLAEVRHVIGAVGKPAGWREVATVAAESGALMLTGDDGTTLASAYDASFLAGAPG